ncbi:MAG: DUF2971 domain-containing protein [Bacteroidetes bacterium]|nr:DUF2971 domain-containing protein [Bacteroidota bacterium]
MYKESRYFHTPDPRTIVWRYIDFTKFVDILTSEQLFFCRSDKFEDPFEGIFQLKDYKSTREMFSTMPETKKFYFLNSWHINEIQSDAMWKIFTNTKNGIAIKSSVGSIIKSLEKSHDDIHIGEIYYRDFDKVTFMELLTKNQTSKLGGGTNQFNYKRTSFKHEQELRLYYIDMPIPHAIKNGVPREPLEFKKVNIDLSLLIHEIIIAPFAEDWFVNLISTTVSKLNYKFKITTSTLYKLKDK